MCRRLFISITRHISFHFSGASMEKIYEGPALLQSITLLGLCPGPCPGPYPSLYWTMSVGKLIKEKQRSFLTSTARGMHIQRMSSLRKVPVIKPLQHGCYWWHGLSSSDMMQHIGILHSSLPIGQGENIMREKNQMNLTRLLLVKYALRLQQNVNNEASAYCHPAACHCKVNKINPCSNSKTNTNKGNDSMKWIPWMARLVTKLCHGIWQGLLGGRDMVAGFVGDRGPVHSVSTLEGCSLASQHSLHH